MLEYKQECEGMSNTRHFRSLFLAAIFLSVLAGMLHAEPYEGRIFTYYQPDGSALQVRLFGDEYYAVAETLAGYTVIRDPVSRYFCFAERSADGTALVSTGIRADTVTRAPGGVAQGVRLSADAERLRHEEGRARLNADAKGRTLMPKDYRRIDPKAPPDEETTGQRVGLVLLIEFPDRPGDVTISQAEVDAYCNEPGYTGFGNAGSVYDYFHWQSDGRLNYNNIVTAYYTAQNTRDYYTDDAISYGTRARELIREALDALLADGFDFSRVDANNDGYIDGVNTFYAGSRVNSWSEGLWPHKSSLSWYNAPSGINSYMQYQITDMTASLRLGTFCHENGHMLCDFPDLYVYSSTNSPEGNGVGRFSLMCSSGTYTPLNVDAYLKYKAGWADVTELTSLSHLRGSVTIDRNRFYRYENPSDAREYFMIEVRRKSGYESGSTLPDSGLTIWHVDEAGSNTYPDGKHYELSVEQADNQFHLEGGINSGGSGDLFHGGYSNRFDDTSGPSAHWWSDGASGFHVHSVGPLGDTMTFIVGAGSLPGDPLLAIDNATREPVCDFGSDAESQSFTIWNAGTGTLNYTVSESVGWLTVSPTSGAVSAETDLIDLEYTSAGLASGTYTATVTVASAEVTNSPQTLAILLTVLDAPGIGLTTTHIDRLIFSGDALEDMVFDLYNVGEGNLDYALESNADWIQASPTSGTIAAEYDAIVLSLVTTNLASGVHTGQITVTSATASNSPQRITVQLDVVDDAEIEVRGNGISIVSGDASPSASDGTDFGHVVMGDVAYRTFVITNRGSSTLALNGSPRVELLGGGVGDFDVILTPNSSLPSKSAETLALSFEPTVSGVQTAVVSIANTDPDENPFQFTVVGEGLTVSTEGFPPNGTMPEGWVTPSFADAGWSVASDDKSEGSYSLKNDNVDDNETASVQYAGVFDAGHIAFTRRVSSEGNYDKLRFYVDGVLQDEWSGIELWDSASYAVSAGNHTVRWDYAKDGSMSLWSDSAWIDEVSLPLAAGALAIEFLPDTLSIEEGRTNNALIRLTAAPTSSVSVSASLTGDSDFALLSGGTYTFTTGNWSRWQQVYLMTAVDADSQAGVGSLIFSAAGLSDVSLALVEIDDDLGVDVSTNDVVVDEGDSATFSIRLTQEPLVTSTVHVYRSSGDSDIVIGPPAVFTFASSNWDTWQPVTLTAVADVDSVAGTAVVTCAGSGLAPGKVTVRERETPVEFFVERFDATVLSNYWSTYSSGGGRIQVTSLNSPQEGTYHLTMDSSDSGTYGLNELILTVDLSTYTNVQLSFWWKEFGDETDDMSASFVGHEESDGIAVSTDGTNWTRLVGFNPSVTENRVYSQFAIDFDDTLSGTTAHYGDTFYIKFQQYDNYSIATDGFAFDDIRLSGNMTYAGGGEDGDVDDDGIPDWWESRYSAGVTNLQPYADEDGDGMPNVAEWIAQTDPTNAMAVFEASVSDGTSASTNRLVFRWASASNRVYGISWTPGLIDTPFSPIATNLPATPPENSYTVNVESIETGCFRIDVRLP